MTNDTPLLQKLADVHHHRFKDRVTFEEFERLYSLYKCECESCIDLLIFNLVTIHLEFAANYLENGKPNPTLVDKLQTSLHLLDWKYFDIVPATAILLNHLSVPCGHESVIKYYLIDEICTCVGS